MTIMALDTPYYVYESEESCGVSTFEVRTRNSCGTSEWSFPLQQSMGEAPPTPVISTAIVSSCQALIRWTTSKTTCPVSLFLVEVQDSQ